MCTFRVACWTLLVVLSAVIPGTSRAADIAVLTKQTWNEFAPKGKEVDCIYGDYVLRNDQITVVIAQPVPGRKANMTVRDVGGCIIDLTRNTPQNDQLSAYYPGGAQYLFESPESVSISVDGDSVSLDDQPTRSGKVVTLSCKSTPVDGKPQMTVTYKLTDMRSFVTAETTLHNTQDSAIDAEVFDALRADRTFTFGQDPSTGLFWAHDSWFRKAYGVLVDGQKVERAGDRTVQLRFSATSGEAQAKIEPGQSRTLSRKIFPANHLLGVRATAQRLNGKKLNPVQLTVRDPAGAVRHADVSVKQNGSDAGSGRTNAQGNLSFALAAGAAELTIDALGRPKKTVQIEVKDGQQAVDVQLEACGYVEGEIQNAEGGTIPCKIAFHGKSGTESPDFGPDSGEVAVQNLVYSHNGQFRQEIGPGKYDVIISYGPEYDIVTSEIEVRRGEATSLEGVLRRSVETKGWVSSDFHSHSTPSGDNTSSQFGRVLNLLCEHIEFAPCTEHNRLSTYAPHLKRLEAEHLLATCVGMELTGSPLPVNHQNAFPLVRKPRTQDGGGPQTDFNPVVQIERLAMWDGESEKLVQQNHPNIVQILKDKDLDGKADGGFEQMFGFMDVIEVHPPHAIFTPPAAEQAGRDERNPIFHWLQLLNLGYRIPGVVNTDAHYNFHGSGGLRNYLQLPTDDPAQIDTMDVVHTCEAGHIIMTNGPYLEVSARAGDKQAIPGDDLAAADGRLELQVRVQCPNWIDINRVQLFLNGRPVEQLNFTRRTQPDRFQQGTVKFDQTIPIELERDTHLIVAVIGEGLKLGTVMGPDWGDNPPTAVSNPIFVDTDGNGFQANGDLLDRPLPE